MFCVNVQVWRVVDFCCQFLEKEVSEDNYLYLQELALQYSLERLDAFIDRFILARFSTLAFTPEFLRDAPSHKLISYLSSRQVSCWLNIKKQLHRRNQAPPGMVFLRSVLVSSSGGA